MPCSAGMSLLAALVIFYLFPNRPIKLDENAGSSEVEEATDIEGQLEQTQTRQTTWVSLFTFAFTATLFANWSFAAIVATLDNTLDVTPCSLHQSLRTTSECDCGCRNELIVRLRWLGWRFWRLVWFT